MNAKSITFVVLMALLATLLVSIVIVQRKDMAAVLIVDTYWDADNNSDGMCSLREAIIAANNNADYNECISDSGFGMDTVMFVGNYTIMLGSPLPAINDTLVINGDGFHVTIDGMRSHPVLSINNDKILNLNKVTIINGDAGAGNGGGVNNNGTLNVMNSIFSTNSATDGGGIYNDGTLSITNSIFFANSATNGGGIYNKGTLTIGFSTFSNNFAAHNGGGIFNENSNPTLRSLILWGDIAANGAEIYNDNSTPNVSYSVVQGYSIGTGNIDINPLFVNQASGDLHLAAGSPVIDNGAAIDCPPTDLDGDPRPQDGNGDGFAVCDIGADER